MLPQDVEEIIARFVGMFSTTDDPLEARMRPLSSDHGTADVRFDDPTAHRASTRPDGIDPFSTDPRIRFDGDRFVVDEGRGGRIGGTDVEVPFHPSFLLHPLQGADEPDARTSWAPGYGHAPRQHDAEVAYREAGPGSILSSTSQTTVLDDRDLLVMSRDAVLPEQADPGVLEALLEAVGGTTLPGPEADAAQLRMIMTTRASVDPDSIGTEGPREHLGWYENGVSVAMATDTSDRLLRDETEGTDADGNVATAVLGGNLLQNQAAILVASQVAGMTVVRGDWHETNSIRQINAWSDRDVLPEGTVASAGARPTEAWSVARFDRIEPGTDAVERASVGGFPPSYRVDVVHGDLQVLNFLRQLHVVEDGDGAVLTTISHDAEVVLGGNVAGSLYDLFSGPRGYDLVVVGGSVWEANHVEQINVLFDDDVVAGIPSAGWSASTGGNLLLNQATIVNYGAQSFSPATGSLGTLVDMLRRGEHAIPGEIGAIPGLHGPVRVLYVEGDYYEANFVSQMNVLGDADRIAIAAPATSAFLAAAGDDAVWTLETGSNRLVNSAAIVDPDDLGAIRFLDGRYYSDSMLVQAELVARDDGIVRFDVDALSPDAVFFATRDAVDDHAPPHDRPYDGWDAHGHSDGVAGMIS